MITLAFAPSKTANEIRFMTTWFPVNLELKSLGERFVELNKKDRADGKALAMFGWGEND